MVPPPSPPAPYHLSGGGKWIRTIGSWSGDQTVMGDGPGCLRKGSGCWGTESSNPPPSSAESANYQFRSRQAASAVLPADAEGQVYEPGLDVCLVLAPPRAIDTRAGVPLQQPYPISAIRWTGVEPIGRAIAVIRGHHGDHPNRQQRGGLCQSRYDPPGRTVPTRSANESNA